MRRLTAHARAFEAKQITSADALIKHAEKRYQGGAGSIVELVDAYRLAQRVRLRGLRLRLQARKAQLTLMQARGSVPGGK